MPPTEWPWDAFTLSAISLHLGRTWVYRQTPRLAVEQDSAPWTSISFPGWQKTELAVAPRGKHTATGENSALYLRRVQRMLFNNEHQPLPASITFVAGKNHVTVFADGLYVGGSSVDVPMGDPQPGSRPRMTSEDPRWITTMRRMHVSAQRLIA